MTRHNAPPLRRKAARARDHEAVRFERKCEPGLTEVSRWAECAPALLGTARRGQLGQQRVSENFAKLVDAENETGTISAPPSRGTRCRTGVGQFAESSVEESSTMA